MAVDTMREHAVEAVARLCNAGFETYWAGGCVRDLLMGKAPKDYDIATAARPEQVAALFPGAVLVGKCFGVVRAPVGEHVFEVATFRADHAYHDGRHPEGVTFSDARTDAQRRDFTVNAIFFDPRTGRHHDFVGGIDDIRRRLLRCVGDPGARFREDRLRLLRAARFAAVLDFTIDPATADAIRSLAASVTGVSAERVRDELDRILVEAPAAGDAVRLLDNLGLLEPLLPEVSAMKGTEQPPEFHPEGDVFTHTVLMLNMLTRHSRALAWSVLLHDVGKPATAHFDGRRIRFNGHAEEGVRIAQGIMERLRFAGCDREAVCACIAGHMRFQDVGRMRTSTLRRMAGGPFFEDELELHRLDCLASHGSLEHHAAMVSFRETLAHEPVLPEPWISGIDVMALGVPQGPTVGRWKQTAYDAQLEGRFPTRESLLAWLENEIRQSCGDPGPTPRESRSPVSRSCSS